MLIDGELLCHRSARRSNFTLPENSLDGRRPAVFFASGILDQDDVYLAPLPRIERKARLAILMADVSADGLLHYSEYVIDRGAEVWPLCGPAASRE